MSIDALIPGNVTLQLYPVQTSLQLQIAAGGRGPKGDTAGLEVSESPVDSGINTRVLFNNNGKLGEYAVSGSGSVAMTSSSRTVDDRFDDIPSLKEFGADPTASASANTAAINAAEASAHDVIYVPEGVYQSNFTPYQVTNKRYIGPGKIEMDGYAQAPMRSFITSPQPVPSTDRLKMFDALGSKQHQASYSFVGSGANPSVLPTEYTNFVEWSPFVHVMDYTAGFNVALDDHAGGRSGAFLSKKYIYHGGEGDLIADSYFLTGYSNKAEATHFIANPAIAIWNGDIGVSSGGHGIYLQGYEFILSDAADAAVACIWGVHNFHRNNPGTDVGQVWIGDRWQSGGSVPVDAVASISGKFARGYDFTPSDLGPDKAAHILKAQDRIYFAGSTAPDSIGINWFATDFGKSWIEGISAALSLYANNQQVLIVAGTEGGTNGLQINGQSGGSPVQLVSTGANAGIQFFANGSGSVTFSNGTWLLTAPSVTDTLVGRATTDTLTNKTINGSNNTLTNIANASLANSAVTINGTSVALGASGTIAAAAGTLTGNTLASGVVNSSLANAADAFTAGALVTASDHATVNGYASISGATLTNHLWVVDGLSNPGAAPGWAKLFVDSADGDLKIVFGDGTTKTIVTDT